MSDSCLFCRISRGEIPSPRVAESDRAFVIRDIGPQAPLHLLVIPKMHVQSLAHTTDATLMGDLLALAARAAKEQGIADDGYRVVINSGENGGQTVQHLHLHVLGGRHMAWPPG